MVDSPSTSAVPAVIDALLAAATTALVDVAVYDGTGISDDPGDFLMVGVEDPDSDTFATSVDAQQSWPHIGHRVRDESGDITCSALSWNGDGDQKAARDAVYAITAQLEELLRDDPTLGLGPLVRTEFGTTSQLIQRQGDSGAMAMLTFKVHFDARI
jgi:hypothetical protein